MADETLFGEPVEEEKEEKGPGIVEKLKSKIFSGKKDKEKVENEQKEETEGSFFDESQEQSLSDYRNRADRILEKKNKKVKVTKKMKTVAILLVEALLIIYVILAYVGIVPFF